MIKKMILEVFSIALICLALLTIKYTLPVNRQVVSDARFEVRDAVLSETANSIVDINLATAEELVVIPGVGEVIAQRIVEDRLNNGYYLAPADITRVKGIGKKTYYKMLPSIKTSRKALMIYLGY